jgi:carbamoyl-phosphate synthase small subunit
MNAVISSDEPDPVKLVEQARNWVPMAGLELASRVTRSEAQTISGEDRNIRLAVFDYGVKQNIINNFVQRGCALRVFPAKTPFEEVAEWNPDGFFFSNGPGDPNAMDYGIETVKQAKKTGKPMFGICLGHQLMALSEGIEVTKMFVGHRGANHPVRNEKTRLVEITTQNHGFSVAREAVDPDKAAISHINLNDHTVEGLEFKNFDGFSVQYHPEASPGPHDSSYLFDQFIDRIKKSKE